MEGQPAGSGNTVLIVDDDEQVRHTLRLLFEFGDFTVVGEADSGIAAVPLALKHRPAFIVLDYLMPGMTGEKTAEIIRGIAPGSRIVAFSAILDEKPAWADAYLNKDRVAQVVPLLSVLGTEGSRDQTRDGSPIGTA